MKGRKPYTINMIYEGRSNKVMSLKQSLWLVVSPGRQNLEWEDAVKRDHITEWEGQAPTEGMPAGVQSWGFTLKQKVVMFKDPKVFQNNTAGYTLEKIIFIRTHLVVSNQVIWFISSTGHAGSSSNSYRWAGDMRPLSTPWVTLPAPVRRPRVGELQAVC